MPGLSSLHVNVNNTSFAYNDILIASNNDSLQLGLDQWVNQMHKTDMIGFEINANLLSIGIRYKRYYFTFNLNEKGEVHLFIPRTLAELAWYGNSYFLGEEARFNSLGVSGNHYREYAIGVSKIIDSRLTVGGRAKLLFGKANVYTRKVDGSLFTDERTFNLVLYSNMEINSSIPVTASANDQGNFDRIEPNENINITNYLLNRQNVGLSFDLGVVYDYSDRIQFSGSILDLGLIRWKSDATNYHMDGEFTYTGTGADTDFNSSGYVTDLVDSILNEFGVKLDYNPYYYFLSPKIYLGGTYRLSPVFQAGVLNYNRIYRSKLYSTLSVSLIADLPRYFTGSLNYTIMNGSYNNLGIGLGFGKKWFQMHLVTDNILGFVNPGKSRNLNVRFGMNILLGCTVHKKTRGAGCIWIREWEEKKARRYW